MKSMCHEARRNSPSVADRRPTASCIRTASRIASSSSPRSSIGSIAAGGEVLARLQELRRAEQAADVVGAERRCRARGHAPCIPRAVTNPADLGVVEAADLLARRALSARELVDACLARIEARDGAHSHEGDPASVNAWVRVYEEDARAAAARADERLARGDAPRLCGIPIGLKDLYAVAGKPLTASSRVLDEVPARDCDAWARLAAEGMVLLGHLHTHEFAAGGTTDQVGNPWALDRSAGGSSGGSAAALAARMTPAATGTDTAGSLRIPSALCGTSTVKPTRGTVPIRGIVPLASTFDHAGPMARTRARLRAAARRARGRGPAGRAPPAAARRALAADRGARPRRRRRASRQRSPRCAERSASSSCRRRRPTWSSTSGSRSSTSSRPRCSPGTAASTGCATATGPRSAASSSTPRAGG